MFLVGDLSNRDDFKGCGYVKVKLHVTKEDLGKVKRERNWQIINLDNLTFFDPEKNIWIEFDREEK